MNDLRELYQEVIFDHYRKPRNYHVLACANHKAIGLNPLCGDQVTVYLKVAGDVIEDVSFEGTGCAISTASASLMTEALKGRKIVEVEHLFNDFHRMVTEDENEDHPDLGKLEALAGVREFPARIKCATLAWHTLQAALKDQQQPVSTE
jgi:nitrogen fixation NifU-like protein